MDNDLRQYLEGRFNQLEVQNAEHFKQMRAYVDEGSKQMREYVDERTRDMETKLLTAFRNWALRLEGTLKPMPAQIAGLDLRMALAEERLDRLDDHGLKS